LRFSDDIFENSDDDRKIVYQWLQCRSKRSLVLFSFCVKKVKKREGNIGSCPHVPATFISSNIPAAADYGVYISQLIRYRRACAQYNVFLDKAQLLTPGCSRMIRSFSFS
jgi:hypothetical protein